VATSRSTDQAPRRGEAGLLAGLSLAAVLAAFAAGGCGEDRLSKPEYEQRVRAVYADVQAAFESTRGASGGELAGRIEKAQDELRDAADELDADEAPEEVEKQNEEIVEGLRAYADDLDELRDAAERNDSERVSEFNEELTENEAVEQIAEAAEEMKFKGYEVGRIAEE
jgi:hypothetical protein